MEDNNPHRQQQQRARDNTKHDYISINDLLEDMVDNEGGGDCEQGDVLGPNRAGPE